MENGFLRFGAPEVREWLPTLPGAPPLAAVFNNAGVAVASSVLDADPDDDEWLRQINFDGVVHGTRAFLPILFEQDEGVIVNTSSVFGLLGMPYQSAYCASKFAVRGFTDALRQELRGTGVRAVTVHPGGVRTNIARSARVAYISTPNRLTLAPPGAEKSDNPWHLREYDQHQYRELLEPHFEQVELLGVFHARKLRAHELAIRFGWDRVHPALHLTKPFYDRFIPAISAGDFRLRPGDLDRSLDFVAVCDA